MTRGFYFTCPCGWQSATYNAPFAGRNNQDAKLNQELAGHARTHRDKGEDIPVPVMRVA